MAKSAWIGMGIAGSVLAALWAGELRPSIQPPMWAFAAPDKAQGPLPSRTEPIKLPGTEKTFTAEQIDDLANPPDWFPEEHGDVPDTILHGQEGMPACASCHLMSGHGHPETADLAGLPVEYLVRQMADFKAGTRVDRMWMTGIGKHISNEDARQAAEWFASLKPGAWVKVVETDVVPKSFTSLHDRVRLPWPGNVREQLNNRIIELPEDASRMINRDPHSGFIAYVPKGSIAKGEALVKTGAAGKTTPCAVCHGDSLEGIGDVPRLAGQHPAYLFRQMLYFYEGGAYSGTSSALMKKVVMKLTEDDMLNIAAYAASLSPVTQVTAGQP